MSSGEVHKKYLFETDEKISEEGLKNSSAKWIEKGSVLIALAGQGKTRGTAAIATDRNYPVCFLASGKYWVNNHAHVLKARKSNENNFICNSLERMDFTAYNTGMAMPKLNKETCKKIPVKCPVFEEQKKIGDYFRSLDHLITLHQRNKFMLKLLENTLFYSLNIVFTKNTYGKEMQNVKYILWRDG